jgi:ribulose-bisphosphate carboxylase large chain
LKYMDGDRILATYLVETPRPVEHAVEVLAGEQSSGTFVELPGEMDTLHERHGARIERIEELEMVDMPSLPGARVPATTGEQTGYRRAEVRISIPLENTGISLPTLLATVAGNIYEVAEVSGLRLMDLELPPAFGEAYGGPRFGVEGTRKLTGVPDDRPVIGTIIKPSVGLSPEEVAEFVRTVAEAGVDFIKDDELLANPDYCPLERRVELSMRIINEVADKTGKTVMYAFNITDDLEKMLRHHDTVVAAGGTCVMVGINNVGLAAFTYLKERCGVPIHAHRNGWGMMTRHPYLGMEFRAYQKIWRLAGADQIHVNGIENKFWEPDDSVVRSIESCLEPMLDHKTIMPVISSGQWGGQAPETYRRTGSMDLMYLAGGGIVAHPGGPAAGVAAIKQAWEAAADRVPLKEYARDHAELRAAMEKFGSLTTSR